MPASPPLPRLKRVPPGIWTGVPWTFGTLFSIRCFFHLPLMPIEPFPPTPYGWALIVSGNVLACPAGCCCALVRCPGSGCCWPGRTP
ncbi:hypothetical protein [Streptomyces sp. 3213.3]|uniref:hypothetical protein n=1 Tax=Streptomyces sp. 3213.3 TaxID=1855348 RepID=UPI000B815CD0|nr:hypothetical protein [Streptomyces sp. 3213.3]